MGSRIPFRNRKSGVNLVYFAEMPLAEPRRKGLSPLIPHILMLRRREAYRNLFSRAPRPQPPWEGRAPARPHGEPPSWRFAAADGTAALPRIAPSACTTAYCNPAVQSTHHWGQTLAPPTSNAKFYPMRFLERAARVCPLAAIERRKGLSPVIFSRYTIPYCGNGLWRGIADDNLMDRYTWNDERQFSVHPFPFHVAPPRLDTNRFRACGEADAQGNLQNRVDRVNQLGFPMVARDIDEVDGEFAGGSSHQRKVHW